MGLGKNTYIYIYIVDFYDKLISRYKSYQSNGSYGL